MRRAWRYWKGRLWCLWVHTPVLRTFGGVGWLDWRGRYHNASVNDMWCVSCNNRWQQAHRGETNGNPMAWHTRKQERRRKA